MIHVLQKTTIILFHQFVGEDAIQPFLTKHPMKTYEEISCIDRPGFFSFTDMVWLHH